MTIDRERIEEAFLFAARQHTGQMRASGESFISHPVSVAEICAELHMDTTTLCAALLHDTVEDTPATIEEVEEVFGYTVAHLVGGVTKLSGMKFSSHDEAQAENYRKMMLAMAQDVRVILVKLADRLHNMRTIGALPQAKQELKAQETLEIYAPLAHRLGIQTLKCELEDLSFATLHPHKYQEIVALASGQREDREEHISATAEALEQELEKAGIEAEIKGRAKHFYSIYTKMTSKGREFNEIYDCYGALGIVHSLWTPLPGRFKDFIAMPKFNMYQSLHTTIIVEGHPLEIQIRTHEMHELAEYGIAAHWSYKQKGSSSPASESAKLQWLRTMLDWEGDLTDPHEFMEMLKTDLFEDEVYVFTPLGEVKSLATGATPLDFAYSVHTEVGHHCVGARVNGKMVPLSSPLSSGDIVEIITAKRERGPSRDWLAIVKTTRARNKIKQWFKNVSIADNEQAGHEMLGELLHKYSLPSQKITHSPLLRDVIRELGYHKSEEFYVALGSHKLSPQVVVTSIIEHLKQGEAVAEETPAELLKQKKAPPGAQKTSSQYGIQVSGATDVMLRLAKCCRPVPGDAIVGYVSLGRGITIHQTSCPNVANLLRSPERFTEVSWEGNSKSAFVVEIQVEGQDRPRLLEDLSRVFAEVGVNILEATAASSESFLAESRFVVEVTDTRILEDVLTRLRHVDSVSRAYRLTPGQTS